MSASPGHGFTIVDGLRLHHLDYGGSGRPIILIHGTLGQAWMWHGVAPALTSYGHVMAIDLRGYGDSQWSSTGDYPTSQFGRDLIGFIDSRSLDGAAVVGFSLGGLVALAAANERPGAVQRLVMVDLPPSSTKSATDLPPIAMEAKTHESARAAEIRWIPNAPGDLVEVMAQHGWRPGDQGKLVRKHDPFFARRWPFREENWWPALEAFDNPLLFVHANESHACTHDEAVEVAERAPRGRLVEIERSGHLIPLDQPTAFTDAVSGFLEER